MKFYQQKIDKLFANEIHFEINQESGIYCKVEVLGTAQNYKFSIMYTCYNNAVQKLYNCLYRLYPVWLDKSSISIFGFRYFTDPGLAVNWTGPPH